MVFKAYEKSENDLKKNSSDVIVISITDDESVYYWALETK